MPGSPISSISSRGSGAPSAMVSSRWATSFPSWNARATWCTPTIPPRGTVNPSPCMSSSVSTGSMSSSTSSTSSPTPSAASAADSINPTWPMVPSSTPRSNSSSFRPAPTFRCSCSRRVRASTIRLACTRSTRPTTLPSVAGRRSRTKPGFTPVPRSATLRRSAMRSRRSAISGCRSHGYESSSQVETTARPADNACASSPSTRSSLLPVACSKTPCCAFFSAAPASGVTITSGAGASTTSDSLRPTRCESRSMAATISRSDRVSTARAMSRPMAPSPIRTTCVATRRSSVRERPTPLAGPLIARRPTGRTARKGE